VLDLELRMKMPGVPEADVTVLEPEQRSRLRRTDYLTNRLREKSLASDLDRPLRRFASGTNRASA
jgi:hypothetical protein